MRNLKYLLPLLLLLAVSFSAYSQANEDLPVSSVLIQLHAISIQQAKQSADPPTALEAEYNQIIDELEKIYQTRLTEAETIYQAKLIELKTSSEKRVQDVQETADQELALIRQKVAMIEELQTKDLWGDIGTNAGWFVAGFGVRSLIADIVNVTQ